jgi:quercetin dioxygenase-like cupin family protein
LAAALLAAVDPGAGAADLPGGGFVAVPLLRTEVTGDAARDAVVARGELAPGATTGRHTHPGDEYAYVIEGTLELRSDGRPPRRVTAGEAYHNPRGVVHETRNVGDGVARLASVFVVDKGKPLIERVESTPAGPGR